MKNRVIKNVLIYFCIFLLILVLMVIDQSNPESIEVMAVLPYLSLLFIFAFALYILIKYLRTRSTYLKMQNTSQKIEKLREQRKKTKDMHAISSSKLAEASLLHHIGKYQDALDLVHSVNVFAMNENMQFNYYLTEAVCLIELNQLEIAKNIIGKLHHHNFSKSKAGISSLTWCEINHFIAAGNAKDAKAKIDSMKQTVNKKNYGFMLSEEKYYILIKDFVSAKRLADEIANSKDQDIKELSERLLNEAANI